MQDLVILKPDNFAAYFNLSSEYNNWLVKLDPENKWIPIRKLNQLELSQIKDGILHGDYHIKKEG